MKKAIITLILILIAVYAVLAILGRGDEYSAEKLFYRAVDGYKKIMINPDVAPPRIRASVENNFKKVLAKYPDSKIARMVPITLAEFYISTKKYDEALAKLTEIIAEGGEDADILSKARFFTGTVYERQGLWDKALKEYMILRDKYADTALGLQVPLYIARNYAGKGKDAEARQAYDEAIRFYDELEANNRGKIIGYAALTMLRQVYMETGDYENAGRVVEDAIYNYPSQQTLVQQLPYVEIIYVNALKRPEKAIEIYSNLKEKVKDEKFIEALDRAIEKLQSGE